MRNRLIALATTLLFHALVVALLLVLQFSTRVVPHTKEIELVPVGVLSEEAAMGARGGEEMPKPQSVPIPQENPSHTSQKNVEEPLLAQPNPEQPKVPSKTAEQRAKERALEEAKRAKEAEEARKKAIANKVTHAFGKSDSKATKITTQEGNAGGLEQGKSGHIGGGVSLAGRSVVGNGGLPATPTDFPPTRGTVVLRIVVNAQGHVIEATQSLRGTNVTNTRTIQAAIRAAKKTQFNPQPSAANQEGTITYNFDIQ